MSTATRSDRDQVKATVLSIFTAVDGRDWEKLKGAFAEDVLLDYGMPEHLTPDQILERWRPLFDDLDFTDHAVMDLEVHVDGDRARVGSRFHAVHFLKGAARGDVWKLDGRYEHVLERSADGWRVRAMKMIPGASTGNGDIHEDAKARDAASIAAFVRVRPTMEAMAEPMDDPHYLPRDPNKLLHADPSRRTVVHFESAGLTLAGHLYRPRGVSADDRTPGVVMAGPISSVKEQTLPHYAERFADAGYTVLTFDSRSFGESEGEPRFHYDPTEVIDDYCNAVRHLAMRDDVDGERIAVVGVCMGGGYAISTAAREKRLKAVVSIAGGYEIGGTFQRFLGVDGFAGYVRKVNEIVARQYTSGVVQYVPTIAKGLSDDVPVAVMPNEEAHSYYDRTSKTVAPNWSPTMTAASLEPFFAYNAVGHAALVAPTPLLVVHGTRDLVLLPECARRVYDAASCPKELVWIETHNHIELYDQDPYVSRACAHAVRWLDRYVKT